MLALATGRTAEDVSSPRTTARRTAIARVALRPQAARVLPATGSCRPMPDGDHLTLGGSGAVFLALCESLRLSLDAAAALLDVPVGAVERWEQHGAPVSVIRTLRDLDREVERLIGLAVDGYLAERAARGDAFSVRLLHYATLRHYTASPAARLGLPLPVHAVLIERLAVALRNVGAWVDIRPRNRGSAVGDRRAGPTMRP